MTENEISNFIIGICINIHRTLGPGLYESVYEDAICIDLKKAGIFFKKQEIVEEYYNGVKLNASFRADIIVEEKVIIEI